MRAPWNLDPDSAEGDETAARFIEDPIVLRAIPLIRDQPFSGLTVSNNHKFPGFSRARHPQAAYRERFTKTPGVFRKESR